MKSKVINNINKVINSGELSKADVNLFKGIVKMLSKKKYSRVK